MEKPTIPYAWAFMHFSLTIIRYPRTAFDFFANHRLAILFPHSWHFQNITTTSGEGTAEGWSLMLMCPETINTSGDGNSCLRDHEGWDIYWTQPVRLILLCWKPGSCLASECLMLYHQSHPISSESSPEAASQQWRASRVPSPYGVCSPWICSYCIWEIVWHEADAKGPCTTLGSNKSIGCGFVLLPTGPQAFRSRAASRTHHLLQVWTSLLAVLIYKIEVAPNDTFCSQLVHDVLGWFTSFFS